MNKYIEYFVGEVPYFVNTWQPGYPIRDNKFVISPRDLFLFNSISLLKDRSYSIKSLEIGSWFGRSSLILAEAIHFFLSCKGSLLCVDLWDIFRSENDLGYSQGDFEYLDFKEKANIYNRLVDDGLGYEIFLNNIKYSPIDIDHFRGTTRKVLPYFADEIFDFIFVDGSHYYKDVLFDIKESDRLLKNGGIICGDDLDLEYEEIDTKLLYKNLQIDMIIDPVKGSYHPGVTLAVHEYFGTVSRGPDWSSFWIMRKCNNGYEKVDINWNGMEIIHPFSNYIGGKEKSEFVKLAKKYDCWFNIKPAIQLKRISRK